MFDNLSSRQQTVTKANGHWYTTPYFGQNALRYDDDLVYHHTSRLQGPNLYYHLTLWRPLIFYHRQPTSYQLPTLSPTKPLNCNDDDNRSAISTPKSIRCVLKQPGILKGTTPQSSRTSTSSEATLS